MPPGGAAEGRDDPAEMRINSTSRTEDIKFPDIDERPSMNPAIWRSEWPGDRHERRRFRPAVSGLEGRQMLSGSTVTTVASFRGSNAAVIHGLTMDGQGNIYGTASEAGSSMGANDASVFEIAHGSNKVTTIASFSGAKGYGLGSIAVDGQGNVYGTSSGLGGSLGDGRVFEIAKGSHTATPLTEFNGSNGEFPNGVTIDAQGNLYGTTAVGGADGIATAFEVARGSNAITPLATFPGRGAAPKAVVVDAQGDLFGTNNSGGPKGAATVYEIAHGSGTVTNLATFGGIDGAGVSHVVVDNQGNLYGTTEDGGTFGDGTVFEIARGSNTVTTLASFNGLTGQGPNPNVGVVVDGQGNLYGTTVEGGTNSEGTIFEIAKGSNRIKTIASFTNIAGTSVSGLMLDGQGYLYGSTDGAGSVGGTVFKLKLNNPAPPTTTIQQTTTVVVTPSTKLPAGPSAAG
jgi:uncharacterized repeat protein (TIGR03803 family)